MLRDLINLVFPRQCPGCDRDLVRGEGEVCTQCLLDIEETGFHESESDNELYYRLAGKIPLDGAFALYYFDKKGKFKKIIQALKYKKNPQVGRFLGELYGEKLKAAGAAENLSAIVPVPLHRSRLVERGYNQSEEIGKGLSKATGVPLVARALVRGEKTATQTRKSKTERWENVKDVFEMRRPLSGNILLVDDVITTGSTLEACIRTLHSQAEKPLSLRIAALGMARHD
jgi:ComF family protein